MILHNIKLEQFPQLEAMFGKKTKSGLEIPHWLRLLKETATTPKAEVYEVTIPGCKRLIDR
jgi:hypothetical protein